MGVIESILLALCLNVTCPINETISVNKELKLEEGTPFQKALTISILEHELKGKHLKIATVQVC